MVTTLIRPITLAEFEALPEDQAARLEVVRGELVPRDPVNEKGERMSPTAKHGAIQVEIGLLLRAWARMGNRGFVGSEVGYVLGLDPVTIRIPDVAYLSNVRRPVGPLPDTNWRVPPDLAVEIVSPSDRAYDVQEKVQAYLQSGVALVWTVWPEASEVVAHTPGGDARTYRLGDLLEFPDVLPGFSCRVDDFFAQDEEAQQ